MEDLLVVIHIYGTSVGSLVCIEVFLKALMFTRPDWRYSVLGKPYNRPY